MDRIFQRVIVPSDLAGHRLDKAAAMLFPSFSRSRLKTWIESGVLTLGGTKAKPKTRLGGGEELVLDAKLDPVIPVEAEDIPLTVVHEDRLVLVIDKPPGLVVHPGAGNPSGTLQNALLNLDASLSVLPRAGIVHRLDKNTSGLLLVARTMSARNRLVVGLERREIERRYEGVCQGVATGGGEVEAPIGRHPKDRLKMAVLTGGRPALTHYRMIEKFRAHTHLALTLSTGRTHQIRVHLAHIRMPLVGDPVYGGRPRFPTKPGDELRDFLQKFPRQALHATQLAFHHPEDGQLVNYRSPLPDDIRMLLEILRKDANAGV
ncbi:MAG: 23S rRNA pseudouridine(1911/1915/1917) synthase RluD [Gammaproteobacteria bacterium]